MISECWRDDSASSLGQTPAHRRRCTRSASGAGRLRLCLGTMDIEIQLPMRPTRPCHFCLCLQGGSVFADFDVDPDGRVFAVRVSFDGYGCCAAPTHVDRMSMRDSEVLLAIVQRGSRGSIDE